MELDLAVKSLAEAFAARMVRHALIGGLAISMRGRPRYTQDIDFLVDVPQMALPGLLDNLVDRGFSLNPAVVIKEYVQEHITAFKYGAVRIDWLKPVLPFYSRAIADASPLDWSEGHSIRVATAEGLILTKMVAFRPQDQLDIDTLLTANRDKINIGLHPRGMVSVCRHGSGANGVAGGRDRQAGRSAGMSHAFSPTGVATKVVYLGLCRPITVTASGYKQRAIMNTELRSTRRALMMKAGFLLIMHWSILASPLSAGEIPVVSAAEAGLSEAKLAEVDKFMEHQVADKKIAGGIVIVARDGKIGLFHAYGKMDLETNQPTRLDTIFRIYSMTKAITTAAALNLVDAGKIGVDDPVSKYIPSFADLKVATPSGLARPSGR